MSDLPARIWATPFDTWQDGGSFCDATDRPSRPNKDAVLYRRADPPPTLEQVIAVPEVSSLIRAATTLRDHLVQWVDGGPPASAEASEAMFTALHSAIEAITRGGAS